MILTISKLDTKRQKKEMVERKKERRKWRRRTVFCFKSASAPSHLSIWFLLFSEPSFPPLSYLSFLFIFSYLNLCVSRRRREGRKKEENEERKKKKVKV